MSDQLPIDYNALLSRAASGDIPQFTRQEQAVMSLISRGRENAISMPRLAELLEISTRDLQQTIQHLINDHGVMIASATGKNHGYYYPESREEYRAAVNQLIHRLISLARRIRAIDKAAYEEIFGQGKLLDDRQQAIGNRR